MKAKTIRQILRKKIHEWIASIDDEALRAMCKENTIVTGGCIASMMLKEDVNDFDIYFADIQTCEAVARYYVAKFALINSHKVHVENKDGRIRIVTASGHRGETVGDARVIDNMGDIEDTYEELNDKALEQRDEDGPRYRPVFMSTNAITLTNKVQIVLRFYGDADAIHQNYDFTHCTNYWLSRSGELTLRPEALEALLSKELRYQGSKYPICSVMRLRKFIKRGWQINAGQILKMLMQVSELDLTDISVLEDQLTGVDSAYFLQVLSAVKEKDPEKINSAYLIEIINRMF